MDDLLLKFGGDLATLVREKNLPITDVRIEDPFYRDANGDLHIYDYLQKLLAQGQSVVFVSHDRNYTESYVNALAVMFDAVAQREGATQKRIFMLDVGQMTQAALQQPDLWAQVVDAMTTHKSDAIFALFHMHAFYSAYNPQEVLHNPFDTYWSGADSEPVCLLPMHWQAYHRHLERGVVALMYRHVTPVLLSMRPPTIPNTLKPPHSPDERFVFA